MTTNTGGPAFPAVVPLEYNEAQGTDYPNYSEAGMTLRDYFAAKAMQGIVSREASRVDWCDVYAQNAYKMADAMLKAREA